ncbi:MAG: ABC transporter permease, partial [Desulfatibacillaceae bacterium]|nr:ABC transporter permease [Desulfatibacillaceae bacterium]
FFILILLVWSAVIKIFDVPSYIAPSPVDVGASISKNARHLLEQTGITMAEAVLGFLVANICGIALSIAFVHSRAVERSVYPYTIALKAVPLVAIAPLLTLWFGTGFLGKVIMAATISFFPIIVNATIGLKSVDPEALHLMRSLSASRLQILLKLRLPSSLPYIFSGLKISSTLSVIGAIVA